VTWTTEVLPVDEGEDCCERQNVKPKEFLRPKELPRGELPKSKFSTLRKSQVDVD